VVAAALVALAAWAGPAAAVPQDINPDVSGNADPNASTGGRVNRVEIDPGNNQVFYATSEYGGIFKSTNGGASWFRLNGFRPVMAWDVEVDPSNSNRVVATSWYDGRVTSLAGIEVSTNGGTTWTRPASATPPAAYNCAAIKKAEPTAFGVRFRPDASQTIVVGTNCGVAISNDSGATWTFRDPTPATTASNIWDVSVQAGGPTNQGIIDVCGDDGHFRSTDNGVNWTGASALPAAARGRCSIFPSPDESYVLFLVGLDNNVYESNDAGGTWNNLGNSGPQGRIPFVVTNQRANNGGNNVFDIWYSDTQLFTTSCTTPAMPAQGGANRCPAVSTWTNRQTGAHWDAGGLEFDSAVTVDACPLLYTSDGGAHTNTVAGSPGCHAPVWTRSNVGLHGLWVWAMDGANQAGNANEDLLFGTQDNGTFVTSNAGAATPTWSNPNCCDTFDALATPTWTLATTCCFNAGIFNRIERGGAAYAGAAQLAAANYPGGNVQGFTFGKRMDTWGGTNAVLLTSSGIFVTTNVTAASITWTALAAIPGGAANACNVRASVTGGTPTFFVQTGQCTGAGNDQLLSYQGTTSTGTWNRIDNTDGQTGGIGVFGVDPNNPNRIYASNLNAAGPRMVFSTDGGTNWDRDTELDTLMTGNGTFKYVNTTGPVTVFGSARARFNGYPQPSFVDWSAENGNMLVAGGQDSGVFLSVDGGTNWSLVTDFDGIAKAHLPRPRYAYFDHEPAGTITVYVGTQGRGVWRLPFQLPNADADGPYSTPEGTDVMVKAGTSSDPDGGTLTYAWDFDNDGDYDDATGITAMFDRVGQDGAYTIGLKVTDPDGGYDTDTATVNVTNVAPSVAAASNGPKPENSPVTVTGVISDPGWLEALTGTIDWGDGTPVQALSGTLENVRPNATLTFAATHTYGDNGFFTARVCGFDDDTSTCVNVGITITNVNPTATIDETGTILVNGVPTVVAHAGDPVTFHGRSTDPGSDDLFLSWDWDDGPPAPDVTTTYLVNPPNPDPFPSPTIQPRDVTDTKVHAFGDACVYDVGFAARDDDGGTASDSVKVLIVGNGTKLRSAGWWSNQYRPKANLAFSVQTLQCYLEIAGFVSTVFNEIRNASTFAAAFDVLNLAGNGGSEKQKLDRLLLENWLNFANGVIALDEPVNVVGGPADDGTFWAVMQAAEAARANPASTPAQLRTHRQRLQRITEADLQARPLAGRPAPREAARAGGVLE
jgi:hypothetical protein